MIIWAITAIYLLLLFVYYKKNRTKSKDTISKKTTPPSGLSFLQMGFLIKNEECSYNAEATQLLNDGYLQYSTNEKPLHYYKKTNKSRSNLDSCKKFFINKIVFPEVKYNSTRDGGRLAYAIDIVEDKTKLENMLKEWANKESLIKTKALALHKWLFGSLFTIFGLLFILLAYLLSKDSDSIETIELALTAFVSFFLIVLLLSIVGSMFKKMQIKDIVNSKYYTLASYLIALIVTNFLLIQMLQLPLNNPYIVFSVALFFTVMLYINLDFFTQKGAELKGEILAYKTYMKEQYKKDKELNNPYMILFGLTDAKRALSSSVRVS